MLDWLREQRLPDLTTIEWTLIGLIAFIVIASVWTASVESDEYERLMQQCMDDGKAEYECRALLKPERKPTTVIVPAYSP